MFELPTNISVKRFASDVGLSRVYKVQETFPCFYDYEYDEEKEQELMKSLEGKYKMPERSNEYQEELNRLRDEKLRENLKKWIDTASTEDLQYATQLPTQMAEVIEYFALDEAFITEDWVEAVQTPRGEPFPDDVKRLGDK